MASPEAVRDLLSELKAQSLAAHRDIEHVLPQMEPHGAEVVSAWLQACRALLDFDREAGKTFIRGSAEAEQVSETVLPWTGQALEFMRWRGSWRALEGFMANLPRAFGSLGHAGERRWAEIGFKWCQRQIDSGSAYFGTPVTDLSGRQGISGIEQLATPAEELFESRKLMLATYLAGAIRVRNLLGAQAILPWALRGADILQSGRARGEAYFRLESEESLALLLEHLPGFRLADRNRLLAMLLDVWFDSTFDLKESSWSPEKGRPFVETDGRTLYFPAVMGSRDEAILSVLHGAGHLRYGTFDRLAMKEMFGQAKIEFPASGPVSWAPLFMRYGDDALRFQLIFDLCEDLRVDFRVQSDVPNYLQRLSATARATGARHPDSGAYFDLALSSVEGALRAAQGRGRADERFMPLLDPASTVADAFRLATEIYGEDQLPRISDLEAMHAAYLPGRGPNATRLAHPQESDDQQQTQSGAEQQSQQQEEGGEESEAQQSGEAGNQEQAGKREEMAGYGESSGTSSQAGNRSEKQRAAEGSSDKGVPYPEWDYREARYKRNWSWVQEKRLSESNMAETNRLMNQYTNALKRLKKAIQSQKPTRLAPKLRQLDGDDMDLNAVVSYVAERYAGQSPESAIYRRREMKQREVAVTLLADMSTSIMQHLPEGGGRLVDRVRAGVLLFAESMEEVGDTYSIAGFCSKYRDNVSYYMIKDFDQPLSEDVRSQIGGLSGRLATRMGAAIRHATKCFEGIESRRRLLLILSDGRPEDYDDGGDRRYLHEDTRMAVKEAVAKGVHPFCITVDTMANQYLPQIFGKGHYLVLDHINSLPKKLPKFTSAYGGNMGPDPNYFIGVDQGELERLKDQHAAWEPETRALWQRAGFTRGQHIADLGCGPGFTSMDLAEIVGASGRVTALDKAATFLEFLASEAQARSAGNIRTVVTDLTTLTQIDGALDGAFSRWFLAFLIADLDHVLQCIYRSLKPGGVLAAMEYLTLESTTASPPMRGFDAHTQGWSRYYEKYGGDTKVGTYLPAKLAAAGFEVTSIECVGGLAKPDHRWWVWWRRLMEDFGEKLVEEGLMSGGDLADLRSDWHDAAADPNAFIYTPVLVQIVARKR